MITRRQVAWAGIISAVGIVIAAVIAAALISAVTATKIRATQVTNVRTLDATERTLEIIQDCTQPGGECFRRSQDRTANVVADLNRVAVLAAACADQRGVQGEDEIYACVIKALARDDRPKR